MWPSRANMTGLAYADITTGEFARDATIARGATAAGAGPHRTLAEVLAAEANGLAPEAVIPDGPNGAHNVH